MMKKRVKVKKVNVSPPSKLNQNSDSETTSKKFHSILFKYFRPECCCSGHKGKGCQFHRMETYTDTEDKQVGSKILNLIPLAEVKKSGTGKNYRYLRYNETVMCITNHRSKEQTKQFKEGRRWRTGVNATMSVLDRRAGVIQLRARNLKAIHFSASPKAIEVDLSEKRCCRQIFTVKKFRQ